MPEEVEYEMISRILGGILTVACIISLFINITVLLTLYFGAFLTTKQSGIYIFAFANIFGNCFTVILFGGYLGPAVMAQHAIFASLDLWPKFFGFLFHIQWFQDMFLQITTAINRLIAVKNPKASQFFTRKMIIGLVILCYVLGLTFAIIAGYLLPCCALYLYWRKFSFYYIGETFNVADAILDWPINSIASLIPIFCYIKIYLYVKTSNNKIITTIAESKAAERKSKETHYALQFAACTGFSILTWINFHTSPLYFPEKADKFFILFPLTEVFHCTSNSLVFLIFNVEVILIIFVFGLIQKDVFRLEKSMC